MRLWPYFLVKQTLNMFTRLFCHHHQNWHRKEFILHRYCRKLIQKMRNRVNFFTKERNTFTTTYLRNYVRCEEGGWAPPTIFFWLRPYVIRLRKLKHKQQTNLSPSYPLYVTLLIFWDHVPNFLYLTFKTEEIVYLVQNLKLFLMPTSEKNSYPVLM